LNLAPIIFLIIQRQFKIVIPMDFDLIVVGLGPAGSTTIIRATELGLNVLGIDKARFPRDKPCGGGFALAC
jgi:flavin-dependent dehydrogenase